ncbi:hypothetical protein TNCV_21641 [Trichonephila clavipes]|nr:hypothetical protein TNCV_21641 [Trichonephila clavipes]
MSRNTIAADIPERQTSSRAKTAASKTKHSERSRILHFWEILPLHARWRVSDFPRFRTYLPEMGWKERKTNGGIKMFDFSPENVYQRGKRCLRRQ